jgi:hypothetical protein
MMDNIDEVVYMHSMALEDIGMVKFQVTRAYNKKVRLKNFQVGDIFWKVIPLTSSRERKTVRGHRVGKVL